MRRWSNDASLLDRILYGKFFSDITLLSGMLNTPAVR